MIVGTIALLMLLFGGGGLEYYLTNLKSEVKEYVVQKDCQEKIIEASKTLSSELGTLQIEIDAHFKELVEIHAEFRSSAEDFDAVAAKLVVDQKTATALILDARDTMHAQMTEQEWTAVFKDENEK
jgi:hypothetical protein